MKAVEALGRYGTIADACLIAGISKTSFYRHEKKDPDFAESCRVARLKAAVPLEAVAWKRAVEGASEKIYKGGELVQERVKPSDALLRLMLIANDPGKYGAAASPAARARMEARLRKEIEAEMQASGWVRPPTAEEEQALKDKVEAMLDQMHARMKGSD